ncbi:hypothetical protein BH24BAC1_BH24BAC1_32510 [soil metagenome]
MHELVHLDLVLQAREAGRNELFTANLSHQTAFAKRLAPDVQRMRKQGYAENVIDGFLNLMFEGLNRQIYNTPIDLFIEDFLYQTYPELRPYQFLSLIALAKEGIQATTDKKILSVAPRWVVTKSKVFNLINAIHIKDLFGVDLVAEHKPTSAELNEAQNCFKELQEYRQDKDPGDEYDLIRYWAEDLELTDFFTLVPEQNYRKQKSVEDILQQVEEDPYGLDEEDPEKEKDMALFLRSHQDKSQNSAVVMYMVEALQYFENLPKSQIKEVAHDIAMLGMTGIDPEKKGYKVASISGKSLTGYQLLGYYYVSWALAMPEMLSMLQLPFDKEYTVAKQFLEKQ